MATAEIKSLITFFFARPNAAIYGWTLHYCIFCTCSTHKHLSLIKFLKYWLLGRRIRLWMIFQFEFSFKSLIEIRVFLDLIDVFNINPRKFVHFQWSNDWAKARISNKYIWKFSKDRWQSSDPCWMSYSNWISFWQQFDIWSMVHIGSCICIGFSVWNVNKISSDRTSTSINSNILSPFCDNI